MAKKSTDIRRVVIAEIKKGKVPMPEMSAFFKYELDVPQRDYILKKVPLKINDGIYCSPLPKTYDELCKNQSFSTDDSTIIKELKWYFDVLEKFNKQLHRFLILNSELEIAVLRNEIEKSLEILNVVDEEISTSFYSLVTEFYLNELNNNAEENKLIIGEMYSSNAEDKVTLMAEYNRIRVDKKITSWQYNSFIDEHKKLYEEQKYIDYINFKLDPLRYDTKLTNLAFISSFDSDFAIIDRYLSIKKILVLVLESNELPSEHLQTLIDHSEKMYKEFGDSYWENLRLLFGLGHPQISPRAIAYYQIQDLFFEGKYDELIEACKSTFKKNPNFSENYLFFIQSLILTNQNLNLYIPAGSDLYDILNLIEIVLRKTSNYSTDREKLLKKYFAINHFGYSDVLLEFILNEYNLSSPKTVSLTNFLSSPAIRYNFYKEVKEIKFQKNILDSLDNFSTFKFVRALVDSKSGKSQPDTFFANKIEIGYLMSVGNYEQAISKLISFEKRIVIHSFPEFVITWFHKNAIKCQIQLGNFDKAADIIVEYFFKNNVAYDHFFDKDLFENLAESGNELFHEDISIPILFQIYNQSVSSIYDAVADFLVSNGVYRPSELIEHAENWEPNKFIFFLEKCCSKENIEDSPFLNSIDNLEQERISILNYLREVNPTEDEKYNEEILKITKESSIRKGLLQIHESRIYVDVNNLSKALKVEYKDVFERYLEFNDTNYDGIYSLKLTVENVSTSLTYYFKEPIDDAIFQFYDFLNDFTTDPNVVSVPYIRYKLYTSLFEDVKDSFVFDEDYGFKSFLSMRIRHGTFSNVLRSVFEKYNLISSKDAGIEYSDVIYWSDKFQETDKVQELQVVLKKFSEKIDVYIDEALAWVKVQTKDDDFYTGTFNFNFKDSELFDIYRNRVGRIINFHDFIEEIFDVLYERLESCLTHLRSRLSRRMTPHFITALGGLNKDVESIGFDNNDSSLLEQDILRCTTEIQVTTVQVTNWFKISKNQYIEEFPFELILQTIINYMNSINQNVLSKAILTIDNSCNEKFRGKYFESFGDILINLLDNIISKNKDLEGELKIDIKISSLDGLLKIEFTNNLPNNTDIEKLQENVQSTIAKIENYKNGSEISFEQGSGFLKLCKLVAVDLNQSKYTILPQCRDSNFEVFISFDLKDLIS